MRKKENPSVSRNLIMLQQLKDEWTLSFVLFCVLSFWDEEWQAEFKLKTDSSCHGMMTSGNHWKVSVEEKSNNFVGGSHE